MVSQTRKSQDEKVSHHCRIDDALLLRNSAGGINADAQLFETFAQSKAEIQKIVQRFGYVRKWFWIQSLLNNESFVNSMLNDIGKPALHDLNFMMKLAVGFKWIDLKPDEFKFEAYEPRGRSSKLVTGQYNNNEKKCSINLGLFTKIFLEPKARQPTNINEKQLVEFLEEIYSTIVHEGFHAVQNSSILNDKRPGNRASANDISNFKEGGAIFVESIAKSLITTSWPLMISNDSSSLENSFLLNFAMDHVSNAIYERHDKIRDMLKNFVPHEAGMFIFAVRYIANGGFINTLKEISKMAEQGDVSNEELYRMLDKDIENGNLTKLKQKTQNVLDRALQRNIK